MTSAISKNTVKLSIGRQKNSISVLFNPGRGYTFDAAGRLVAIYAKDLYVARGLDGAMKVKSWTGARDVFDRFIEIVPPSEKQNHLDKLKEDLRTAAETVGGDPNAWTFLSGRAKSKKEAIGLIEFLILKTERLPEDEKRFREIYGSINILPPDQYFTVVLQIVEGCPWNKCTFCDFYRGRKFRIRTADEIKKHIDDVAQFFGQGLSLRRSVFLADANAFVVPTEDLVPLFKRIQHRFPEQMDADGGIYSFADVPAVLGKAENELKMLQKEGLRRVYIGMESGSEAVRLFVRKPASTAGLEEAVRRLKESEIEVGLIAMLGLGGEKHAADHVESTAGVLSRLPLDRRDIVYFSPFDPRPHSDYAEEAKRAGIKPLSPSLWREQFQEITSRAFSGFKHPPKVALYNIREFVY